LAQDKSSYCEQHKPTAKARTYNYDYNSLYNNANWIGLRKCILLRDIVCSVCGDEATQVDHIVPHRGNKELFWDVGNLQSLCQSCHSKKTTRGE